MTVTYTNKSLTRPIIYNCDWFRRPHNGMSKRSLLPIATPMFYYTYDYCRGVYTGGIYRGGGGIYSLNSPIATIKLVHSPITKNSELFHQPLSHVTRISCITIHHLKYMYTSFTNHQELKQLVTKSPELIYSQFTFS